MKLILCFSYHFIVHKWKAHSLHYCNPALAPAAPAGKCRMNETEMTSTYLCIINFNVHSDVYFRKSGLERSESIAKDLEWFREKGIQIPEASTSGLAYAAYLTELAESNAPAFLSHYYNIYFAHTTGGVAIGSKVTPCPDRIQSPLPSLFNYHICDPRPYRYAKMYIIHFVILVVHLLSSIWL